VLYGTYDDAGGVSHGYVANAASPRSVPEGCEALKAASPEIALAAPNPLEQAA
jgi:hypothetical protein